MMHLWKHHLKDSGAGYLLDCWPLVPISKTSSKSKNKKPLFAKGISCKICIPANAGIHI